MGSATTSTTNRFEHSFLNGTPGQILGCVNQNTTSAFANTATTIGSFITSRVASNSVRVFANGSLVDGDAAVSTSLNAFSVYIGARNTGGSTTFGVALKFQFAFISSSLSDADVSNLHTIIAQFQTNLSR
jgi:hypothetical protein